MDVFANFEVRVNNLGIFGFAWAWRISVFDEVGIGGFQWIKPLRGRKRLWDLVDLALGKGPGGFINQTLTGRLHVSYV